MGTNIIAATLADEKPATVLHGKAEPEIAVKQRGKQNSGHFSVLSLEGYLFSEPLFLCTVELHVLF